MVIAGRYSGGPAKVAIFSSAFMGTISGSSIANTVTTGALTIPAMKKVGYPAHFSGAVEATSSTGGQITPPILGAAAFIMVEYLEIPLRDVLAAALFPALLHYFGIFIMVHLEAKKLGLRGLQEDELPKVSVVLKDHWLSLIPLIILVYLILSGKTPDFAAVYGIIACVVVGFLNPTHRLNFKDLWDSLASGAKNTLAVGAAAATVAAGKLGRPVRLWMNLEDNMRMLGKRNPYMMNYEVIEVFENSYRQFYPKYFPSFLFLHDNICDLNIAFRKKIHINVIFYDMSLHPVI